MPAGAGARVAGGSRALAPPLVPRSVGHSASWTRVHTAACIDSGQAHGAAGRKESDRKQGQYGCSPFSTLPSSPPLYSILLAPYLPAAFLFSHTLMIDQIVFAH